MFELKLYGIQILFLFVQYFSNYEFSQLLNNVIGNLLLYRRKTIVKISFFFYFRKTN